MAVPKKRNKKVKYKYSLLKKKVKNKIINLISNYKKIKKKLRLNYKRKIYW